MGGRKSGGQDQVWKTKTSIRENKWEPHLTAEGRDSRRISGLWTWASRFHCSTSATQTWPSWKSHQEETSPAAWHQNSSADVCKRTSRQAWGVLETSPENQWGGEQRSVWRTKGSEFGENNICPAVNHGAGSMRDHLTVGEKDSVKFKQMVEANIRASVKNKWKKADAGRGWLLQMDKDPKCTSDPPREPLEAPAQGLTEVLPVCWHWRSVARPLTWLEDFSEKNMMKISETRTEWLWPQGGAVVRLIWGRPDLPCRPFYSSVILKR